jgi:hypothetical protein
VPHRRLQMLQVARAPHLLRVHVESRHQHGQPANAGGGCTLRGQAGAQDDEKLGQQEG